MSDEIAEQESAYAAHAAEPIVERELDEDELAAIAYAAEREESDRQEAYGTNNKRVDLAAVADERGEPRAVMAARLALTVMKHLGARTWAEVATSPNLETVLMTPDQRALLIECSWVLPLLRWSSQRTIYMCPVCGLFGFLGSNASLSKPPTKCNLTMGCVGKPVHAQILGDNEGTAEFRKKQFADRERAKQAKKRAEKEKVFSAKKAPMPVVASPSE